MAAGFAFDHEFGSQGDRVATCNHLSTFVDTVGMSIYVDGVTDLRGLTDAADSADPAVGLRAVRALRRLQERLEAIHVANARAQGWSWQAIAEALGVSRQAVHQKFNRRK